MHLAAITADELTPYLLVGTSVLLVAVGAVRFAVRAGMPTLLAYLALGLMVGNSGLGFEFTDATLTHTLGYIALIFILAEGGLTTEWGDIKASVLPALVLSTLGVVVSTLVIGVFLSELVGMEWKVALLFGAVLSSTDAAAVFSVLRHVPLPRRLTGILEAESGLNDAPVVLMVVILSQDAMPGAAPTPWWEVLLTASFELAVGALIGVALGAAGVWFLRKAASPSSGLFAMGVLAVTVLAYAAASAAHTSGFLATYVAALVLGNSAIPHRPAVRSFAQAMGWFAQIFLFVLLGMLANPTVLIHYVVPAVILGAVLLLLARPLSVAVSLTPFKVPWREQAFVSWAGLRGAVPVVLATVPLTQGTPGTEHLFDIVFVLVVVFTLVQGPPMPWIARRLKLQRPEKVVELAVESTPLTEMGAEMLHVRVGPGSKLQGVRVREVRLPEGTNVTLIVRKDRPFVPDRETVFRTGDDVLVVAKESARDQVEELFHLVSRRGRLPKWHRPGARRTAQPPGRGGLGRGGLGRGVPGTDETSGTAR